MRREIGDYIEDIIKAMKTPWNSLRVLTMINSKETLKPFMLLLEQ